MTSSLRTLCLLLLAALLAACGGGGNGTPLLLAQQQLVSTPVARLALKSFSADCHDFLAATADSLTEQYLRPQFNCPPGALCPVYLGGPSAAGAPAAAGAAASVDAPLRVSQTNTQEAGVDEPDIVRSDSQGHVYVLRSDRLLAFSALPAAGLAGRAVSTLLLGNSTTYYAGSFFLDEAQQRLVIFGQRYDGSVSRAVAQIVSLADPLAPAIVGELAVDGYGIDARRIGARVHRVASYYPPQPAWFTDPNDPLVAQRNAYLDAQGRGDSAGADRIRSQVHDAIAQRVSDAGAAPFLPLLSTTLNGSTSESRLACDHLSHPDVTMGEGMTVVDSFGSDGSARGAAGITSYAYMIYASEQNLYLVQPSYGWFFAPNQRDETAVFRFALGAGAPAYASLGKLDGWVPSSYALSEFEGHLRAVTSSYVTVGDSVVPSTRLAVLRIDAAALPQVGSIDNIAQGEVLRGERLLGARGFLDTFRNVDPLFAFDLSDPAHPRLVSELTIPGFSSYIAPVGDHLLLTVGRAGDEQRLNHQIGIGLFDVTNLHHVQQLASLSPAAGGASYSYSIAEYDPHAFSYFPDSDGAGSPGTLSLPLQGYDGNDPSSNFAGFLVVRVDAGGAPRLAELGRIDHRGFTDTSNCSAGGGTGPASGGGTSAGGGTTPPACPDTVYYTEPRRSVFMQESGGAIDLFTFSDLGVIASDAHAPATELGRRALDH